MERRNWPLGLESKEYCFIGADIVFCRFVLLRYDGL